MSGAVIGLVGVVIGGVLTGGTNFLLEWRRERRAGRAAARLVHASLSDADAFIKASLVRRMWVGDPLEALAGDIWAEHRNSLAAAPGFNGWYPVAGAWGWIAKLRHFIELLDEGPGSDPLEDRDEDFLRIGLMLIGIADVALVDYAKTTSYSDPPDAEGRSADEDDEIEKVLEVAKSAKPKRTKRR